MRTGIGLNHSGYDAINKKFVVQIAKLSLLSNCFVSNHPIFQNEIMYDLN